MTDDKIKIEQGYTENDYCPICGLLAIGKKRHICPEDVLDEICKEEEAKSEEFDDDADKTYGERLDDADFMDRYYEGEYDEDEDIFI